MHGTKVGLATVPTKVECIPEAGNKRFYSANIASFVTVSVSMMIKSHNQTL